uniref:Uncharacterized protein n=1 Tax=Knipowitschia caucasica TaxID=637954 RepID=A0AAV2J6Z3_KNICA
MAVRARRHAEPAESDVNYASLDLMLAMKRKRQSHRRGQCPPDRLQDRLTPPLLMGQVDNSFPPTEHDPMEPHGTIYLNSHQIDMERRDNNEQRVSGWNPDAERQEEDRDEECGNDQRLKDENKDDSDHMAGSDAHQY